MQIFVDLDGVLADFDRGYKDIIDEETFYKVDWDIIRNTPHFFRDLELMPDAIQLWDYVKKYNPIILTGVPYSIISSPNDKRKFVDKHFGKEVPMIACRSKDKFRYMHNTGDILIDDREELKYLWERAGGYWITHTSATNTVNQLCGLGF